jgi:hypothetical protein
MTKAALKTVKDALSRHAVQTATDAEDRARRQAKLRREQQEHEEKRRQKAQRESDEALARELHGQLNPALQLCIQPENADARAHRLFCVTV